MAEFVTLETPEPGVALVTYTNPAINNHCSWKAVEEMAAALREAREGGTRACVLASGVEGHWFEHAWLTDIVAMLSGGATSGEGSAWFDMLQEIANPAVVQIAAISGDCSGGGVELGWACDLRIAEEQACFGQPEVQINLTTGIGGTSRLARLIGRTVTAEMVLDGAYVSARRIYELGGLNRVVPKGKARDVALEWAGRIARQRPESLSALKQMLHNTLNMPLDEALQKEQEGFQSVANTPEAIERMKEIQAKFDSGVKPREFYGGPRD